MPVDDRPLPVAITGDNTWGPLMKRFPDLAPDVERSLTLIWDEVVARTIMAVLEPNLPDGAQLHINLKGEMALETAKLLLFLSERVVDDRLGDRTPTAIDLAIERKACLGEAGRAKITQTARNFLEAVWKPKMEQRWLPKSKAALEREENPPPAKPLAVKRVDKNHFIPRWFIRDHWSTGGHVTRWRRDGDTWARSQRSFGAWGYRPNLFSDRLEAYFALIDGDAKTPLRMLLATEPLNGPQREALIGFLVIGMLRNPFLIAKLEANTRALMAATDDPWGADSEMPRKAYEALFRDNAFYDRIARPLLWSRWALVRSQEPVFVLPDAFCIRCAADDGSSRILAPLSPSVCFVTLFEQESEKAVVPYGYAAPPDLAQDIASLLSAAAVEDMLSAPGWAPPAAARRTLPEVLHHLERERLARDGGA